MLLTFIDDRPKIESDPIKLLSPGPRLSESTLEKADAPSLPLLASSSPEMLSDVPSHPSSGCIKPTAAGEPEFISPSTTKAQTHLVNSGGDSIPETSLRLCALPSTSLKVVNGLAESQTPLSSYKEPEVQEALKISLTHEVQLPTQGYVIHGGVQSGTSSGLGGAPDKAPPFSSCTCALDTSHTGLFKHLLHHYCPWTTTWFGTILCSQLSLRCQSKTSPRTMSK